MDLDLGTDEQHESDRVRWEDRMFLMHGDDWEDWEDEE